MSLLLLLLSGELHLSLSIQVAIEWRLSNALIQRRRLLSSAVERNEPAAAAPVHLCTWTSKCRLSESE